MLACLLAFCFLKGLNSQRWSSMDTDDIRLTIITVGANMCS